MPGFARGGSCFSERAVLFSISSDQVSCCWSPEASVSFCTEHPASKTAKSKAAIHSIAAVEVVLLFLNRFILFFILPALKLSSKSKTGTNPARPPLSHVSLSFDTRLLRALHSRNLHHSKFMLRFRLLPEKLRPPLPHRSSFPV